MSVEPTGERNGRAEDVRSRICKDRASTALRQFVTKPCRLSHGTFSCVRSRVEISVLIVKKQL